MSHQKVHRRRCILCARGPWRLLTHLGSHQLRSREQGRAGSRLRRGQREGDVPKAAPIVALAAYYSTVLHGLAAPIKGWRLAKDAHAGRRVRHGGLATDGQQGELAGTI